MSKNEQLAELLRGMSEAQVNQLAIRFNSGSNEAPEEEGTPVELVTGEEATSDLAEIQW